MCLCRNEDLRTSLDKVYSICDVSELKVHVEDKISTHGNGNKKPRDSKDVSFVYTYLNSVNSYLDLSICNRLCLP